MAREIHADMVEHTIEQDPQAAAVRLGDQVVEVGVVAEPGIDAVVVSGVVTMGARREDRPQRDTGCPQRDGVVEPADQPPQPVFAGPGG